jgi:hypothetical protein
LSHLTDFIMRRTNQDQSGVVTYPSHVFYLWQRQEETAAGRGSPHLQLWNNPS